VGRFDAARRFNLSHNGSQSSGVGKLERPCRADYHSSFRKPLQPQISQPPPMTRDDFLSLIRTSQPGDLCRKLLLRQETAVFTNTSAYEKFRSRVSTQIRGIEEVHLAGSGKWGYSLNPQKGFKQFDTESDIDVAIISEDLFHETWNTIREYHRNNWYAIDHIRRKELRRHGENIYSGFVSPRWIPEHRSPLRFAFNRTLNRLSDANVSFRRVTALYFRNIDEAIDYYKRGFFIARSRLDK